MRARIQLELRERDGELFLEFYNWIKVETYSMPVDEDFPENVVEWLINLRSDFNKQANEYNENNPLHQRGGGEDG